MGGWQPLQTPASSSVPILCLQGAQDRQGPHGLVSRRQKVSTRPPQNSGASWPQPLITVENTNAAHVEADSDFQALTLDVVFEVTLV